MYLNSSRERILKYILLVVGFVSVSVSLYMAHGIYFSNWSTAFSQRTFKLYHFVLLIGYLFLTFFTGLNKSFFRRKIFGETVVVLYYVSALITGLIRETGISGNFVGRIKGAKCPFDLQFLTWDFS